VYLAAIKAHPLAINMATLVGHSILHVAAMEDVSQPATEPEIEAM
jgi:N-acyl-D-aspartate/D-glutamate deacylase